MSLISANAIEAAIRAASSRGVPPVESWDPPYRGDLDIRIARDGTWYHEGGAINRPELVRLFSTILIREDDRYFLVTPVEKVGITVEDAPFIAVDAERTGEGTAQTLTFLTNVGDRVDAGPDNQIRLGRAADGSAVPYLHIRRGLEARIDRKTFYRLAEIGEIRRDAGEDWFGIWSGGQFHALARASDLEG